MKLFFMLAVMCLVVVGAVQAQLDSTTFSIRDIGGGVCYLGIGPGADQVVSSVGMVAPGEVDDLMPLELGFGNEGLTDSADITIRCLRNLATNGYRVVIENTTVDVVLASIVFRPTLNVGEYELDIPVGSDVPPSTVRTVDSVREETLKWAAFGAYFVSAQVAKVDCPSCPIENTPCIAYYPRDDMCSGFGDGGSGPFNINRVRVYVPCYGTTWVNLTSCCITHDRQLWCTEMSVRGLTVQGINFGFFGCVLGSIATTVMERTPWYCGGALVGVLVGASQGLVAASAAYLAVTGITAVQLMGGDMCYISMGKELNSCLCGGNVRTVRCVGHVEVCKGNLAALQLSGLSGEQCFCDENPQTMEITPAIDGAIYTWYAEGDVTVIPDTQEGRTAQVTATGVGAVTVVVEIPGCGDYKRAFSKMVTSGVPPKPVITNRYGGAPADCIPRRPGSFWAIDLDKGSSICPTEYRLVFTSNVGGTVVDYTASGGQWSTHGNWFLARPDVQFEEFCLTVTARNKCGESEPTVFCVDVIDGCVAASSIVPEELSEISFTDDNGGNSSGVLYPNPTVSVASLRLAPSQVGSVITVVDMNGVVVRSIVARSEYEQISLHDVAVGMYVVSINMPSGTASKTLVVTR